MPLSTWDVLVSSLFDWNGRYGEEIAGNNLGQWIVLIQHDYDEVDALYLHYETIGA